MPTQSKNPAGGIFQYLLQIQGTDAEVRAAQAQLAKLTPETAAVYQALNILPEGDLKSWLMANPVQFWRKVVELFTGRKYTTGDYVLGERLNDQVYDNPDIGQKQVSNQMVELAHAIFNQLFGVRIATAEDLDALDHGVVAYKARAVSQGIGTDAIERAVYLKQHYYPIATYNRAKWDLRYFEIYPLVDRIPDYNLNKWYSGPLIGGATAVDGLIPLSATSILKQYPGANFDPTTGNTELLDGTIITPGVNQSGGSMIDKIISLVKTRPIVVFGVAVAAAFAWSELEENE